MNAHERRFKSILATAANAAGEHYGRFRHRYYVDEFFTDVLRDEDDVFVVAAKAIEYLCTDVDGNYNRNVVAIKAVFQFLKECTIDSPMSLTDLRACQEDLFNTPKEFERLLAWCGRWYKVRA